MPKELQQSFEALNRVELTELAVLFSAFDGIPVVDGIVFSIGVPDLHWKVWGDHLVVEDLAARFELRDRFTQSMSLLAGVSGTLDIEGVPVSILAESGTGFTVYARLRDEQTVPLKKMMATHAPAIPAPADLTIDRMGRWRSRPAAISPFLRLWLKGWGPDGPGGPETDRDPRRGYEPERARLGIGFRIFRGKKSHSPTGFGSTCVTTYPGTS